MQKVKLATSKRKIEQYGAELTARGFTDFTITQGTEAVSSITINVPAEQVDQVREVCRIHDIPVKNTRYPAAGSLAGTLK